MSELAEFLARYGYWVVFAFVLAEQLGVPVPAVPVLLAMGASAGMGRFSPALALLVAVSAALIADAVWFQLGRRHGAKILKLLCRISLEPDSCVRRTEAAFAARGAKTLLFSKFVPGLNTVAAPVAGMMKMPRARFVGFAAAGGVFWAGTYLTVGYLFSRQIDGLLRSAERLGGWVLLVAGLGLATWIAWKYVQRRRFMRSLSVARITPSELKRKLDLGEDIVIVDLRQRNDFEDDTEIVPGALQMSPEDLDLRHGEIPRDRDVVLYCT